MLDLLFLAIAPSVFIFMYIYAKDRYEPEPLHLVLWIFLLGCLSTIPAGLIEILFADGLFTSAVVAPVVEEICKFLVVYLFIWKSAEFDEPMDGIVYATAASLGFATIENIFYVIDGGMAVGILRAFLSVPGHVIFSCLWGAALGIAKFRPAKEQAPIILAGLLGAMLLHGIFNFSIEALDIWGVLLILVLVPAGAWWTCRSIRCAHAHPASYCSAQQRIVEAGTILPGIPGTGGAAMPPGQLPAEQRFCTGCGAPLRPGASFCENCGRKR